MYLSKRPNTGFRVNFVYFRGSLFFILTNHIDKKRPNTIPIFGLGKWLLGESRALKVGIYAGLVQPCTLRVA